MNFTELQTYYSFKLLRVDKGDDRISSIDFWSTLILLSTGSVDEKIISCCKLIDVADTGFISYSNLLILFICSTRGVAKLKGFTLIPLEHLEKTLIEIFAAHAKLLNENGDISITNLRDYMKSNDIIRTYLNSLGSRTEAPDPSALAAKRSNLLKDLATVQAEIERTARLLDELDEDEIVLAHERGGDIKLLRLQDNPTLEDFNKPLHSRSNDSSFQSLLIGPSSSFLPVMLTIPLDHPSRRHFLQVDALADAEAFLDSRACKPAGTSKNIFGENFKVSFFQVWNKLPGFGDGTAYLDEYTLMGLFDNIGIFFSFFEAKKCLNHLRSQKLESQIGRFSGSDVLKWFRLYGNVNLPREESAVSKQWLHFCSSTTELTSSIARYITQSVEELSTQRKLIKSIDSMPSNLIKKNFSFFKSSRNMEKSVSQTADRKQKKEGSSKIQMSKDLAFLLSLHDFLNINMSKDPTNIFLRYSFGRKLAALLLSNSPEKPSNSKSPSKKTTAQKHQKEEESNKWKTSFKVFFSVNPFAEIGLKSKKPVSRIKKTETEAVIKDFNNLHSVDLLIYFNDLSSKSASLSDESTHPPDTAASQLASSSTSTHNNAVDTPPLDSDTHDTQPPQPSLSPSKRISYSSCGWLCFQLKDNVSRVQEMAVVAALSNMLNSIPHHSRKLLYSAVLVDAFTVNYTSLDDNTKSKKKSTDNYNVESSKKTAAQPTLPAKQPLVDQMRIVSGATNNPRVILVACFNERDYFQELERFMVELDIFLSRSFTKGEFEMNLTDSFKDIYAHSAGFHCFEEMLFGPQEVDLKEEGMNPLKYAKELKQRKAAAMEFAEQASKMNMKKDELIQHCRILGIKVAFFLFICDSNRFSPFAFIFCYCLQ